MGMAKTHLRPLQVDANNEPFTHQRLGDVIFLRARWRGRRMGGRGLGRGWGK
jgi:hypothetical protein